MSDDTCKNKELVNRYLEALADEITKISYTHTFETGEYYGEERHTKQVVDLNRVLDIIQYMSRCGDLHPGDEIYSSMRGTHACVVSIDAWSRIKCVNCYGETFELSRDIYDHHWHKTGKNFSQLQTIFDDLTKHNEEKK